MGNKYMNSRDKDRMLKTGSNKDYDKQNRLKTDVTSNREQSEAQDIIDWYYSNKNTTHIKMIEPV